MSYYRRGYRFPYGRSRLGYRRGYNRYWRRNWGRQRSLYGSQAAGSRRFSIVVPCEKAFQMIVSQSNFWSQLLAVSPYGFIPGSNEQSGRTSGSLLSSVLYRTYCGLYDEVKIDSCFVKFTIMSLLGNGGVVPALKFVSMWDRQSRFSEIVSGSGLPSSNTLSTGSESQATFLTSTSRGVVTRFNRASDLQERTTFHDCSISTNGSNVYDGEWAAGGNVGYAPALYFALNTATSPGSGLTYTFNCSIEVRWKVTFRNPKFGLSAGQTSAKGESFGDMKQAVVEEIKDDAESESPIVPVDEKVPDTEVKPVKVGDVWYMQCSDGILRPLEISGKDGSEVLDDDETVIVEKKG